MKKVGFYAGSFDPFTKGHWAIVCEALCRFDTVIVGIGVNPSKETKFSADVRKNFVLSSIEDLKQFFDNNLLSGAFIRGNEAEAIKRLKNEPECLQVVIYNDLTVDAALRCGATALVRGVRNDKDRAEEAEIEAINHQLLLVRRRKLKQVRIQVPNSNPDLKFVSSSAVKALVEMGEYIAAMNYVMPSVHAAMVKPYLQERYCAAYEGNLSGSWKALREAYSTSREYHTLSHLAYCFNYVKIFLATKKVRLSQKDKRCLDVAIFWHDFYCGVDNAEQEAADAVEAYFEKRPWFGPYCDFEYGSETREARQQKRKEKLGVFRIKDLILATRHSVNGEPSDFLEKLIHDVDLAILGDRKNYGTYAMQVRAEYADCATETYAEARIAVLQSLLDRERLFLTDFFHEMLEKTAKANLQREISFWQKGY